MHDAGVVATSTGTREVPGIASVNRDQHALERPVRTGATYESHT